MIRTVDPLRITKISHGAKNEPLIHFGCRIINFKKEVYFNWLLCVAKPSISKSSISYRGHLKQIHFM